MQQETLYKHIKALEQLLDDLRKEQGGAASTAKLRTTLISVEACCMHEWLQNVELQTELKVLGGMLSYHCVPSALDGATRYVVKLADAIVTQQWIDDHATDTIGDAAQTFNIGDIEFYAGDFVRAGRAT